MFINRIEITLTEKQRNLLTKIASSQTYQSNLKMRAQIILDAANKVSNRATREKLQIVKSTIIKWKKRWCENASLLLACEDERLKGIAYERKICEVLSDLPRPGTPAKFTAEQICQIMSVACESPEDSGLPLSHWSLPSLASELVNRKIVDSISTSQLHIFLKSNGHQATQGKTMDPYAH